MVSVYTQLSTLQTGIVFQWLGVYVCVHAGRHYQERDKTETQKEGETDRQAGRQRGRQTETERNDENKKERVGEKRPRQSITTKQGS